jgi:hypothetical protein
MANSKNHLRSVGPEETDVISTLGADVPHGATPERVKDSRSVSRSNLV